MRGATHGDGAATASTVDAAFAEVVADYAGSYELIWDGLARSKRQLLRYDAPLAPGKPVRVSDPFFAAWVRGLTA